MEQRPSPRVLLANHSRIFGQTVRLPQRIFVKQFIQPRIIQISRWHQI